MKDYKVSCEYDKNMTLAYGTGYKQGYDDAFKVMCELIKYFHEHTDETKFPEKAYQKMYERIVEGRTDNDSNRRTNNRSHTHKSSGEY